MITITKGKKYLAAGAGISGIAAAELLLEKNLDVTLYDSSEKLTVADIRARSEKLKNIPVILGGLTKAEAEQFAAAVLSPGIPLDSPAVKQLRACGVEILGEIELAWHYAKGRVAAITGTNGKTTTTALTGEIFKNYYSDVQVVGNIGIPYTSVVSRMTDETVTAAEISSFQLETIQEFCPEVSAILNITPDHLNRHHTMEQYAAVKKSITKNQKPEHTCVLNYEDDMLREFGKTLAVNVIYFSSKRKLERGLYLEGGVIYLARADGAHNSVAKHPANCASDAVCQIEKVIAIEELNLLGIHNYENVMAATAVSLAMGVPLEKIVEVLKTFQAVEHRIEYTAEIAGVRYYNDSKATNPDAAIQGIRAMNRMTYLIGGGYDKQSEYETWIRAFDGRVRELVLIGDTKEKIAKAAEAEGFEAVFLCETLEEAVRYCSSRAQPGEAVLLSPACASWDMFKSYEERGRVFKEIVHGLAGLKDTGGSGLTGRNEK